MLPASDVDLEIRQGNGSWPGFRAAKLHDDHAVAVYGPGYVRRYGRDVAPGDLCTRPRVQVLGFDDVWRRFFAAAVTTRDAPRATVTVDTSVAALEVVASSDLWAVVPERFARQGVATGRLLQAPGAPVPMRQAHYLLRSDNAGPPSGQALAFTYWLREQEAADLGIR